MPQRNGGPHAGHVHAQANATNTGASSVGTSEDGEDNSSVAAEDEEDYQASVVEQLSAIQKPEVRKLKSIFLKNIVRNKFVYSETIWCIFFFSTYFSLI